MVYGKSLVRRLKDLYKWPHLLQMMASRDSHYRCNMGIDDALRKQAVKMAILYAYMTSNLNFIINTISRNGIFLTYDRIRECVKENFMYSYIKGIIADLYSDHIVIDNHGIGYEVHVSNPYNFKKGDDATVYIYQQVKEDDITLFGFKKKEEKNCFKSLFL